MIVHEETYRYNPEMNAALLQLFALQELQYFLNFIGVMVREAPASCEHHKRLEAMGFLLMGLADRVLSAASRPMTPDADGEEDERKPEQG